MRKRNVTKHEKGGKKSGAEEWGGDKRFDKFQIGCAQIHPFAAFWAIRDSSSSCGGIAALLSSGAKFRTPKLARRILRQLFLDLGYATGAAE